MKKLGVILSLLAIMYCGCSQNTGNEKTVDYSGSWEYSMDICIGWSQFLCEKNDLNGDEYIQFTKNSEANIYSYGAHHSMPFPIPSELGYDSNKIYKFKVKLQDGFGVKFVNSGGTQYYFDFDGKEMFLAERDNPPKSKLENGKFVYLRGVMRRGYSKTDKLVLPSNWPKDTIEIKIE